MTLPGEHAQPIPPSFAKTLGHRLLAPLARIRDIWRHRRFRRLPRVDVDASSLGFLDHLRLESLLDPKAVLAAWVKDQQLIEKLLLPEMTGGVNPGDQRALHALALGLRPTRILEVGTHLGCSTVPLALAARRIRAELVTCDVVDVNDETRRPWLGYGSKHSPRSLISDVGCSAHVQFVTLDSLDYLRKSGREFDLIFLDGDHAAAAVYQELPLALEALHPGGYVLLHDYYPDGRAIWSDDPAILGPFLAVERLRAEGAQIDVMALGTLPWPTRSGSCATSLALVSRSR